MRYFQEYSLLVAIATPVAVIVVMNLVLALRGERGTLLMPLPARYPRVDLEREAHNCAPTIVNDFQQTLPIQTLEPMTLDARAANAPRIVAEVEHAA